MFQNLLRDLVSKEVKIGEIPQELVDQAKLIKKHTEKEQERINGIVEKRIEKVIEDAKVEFAESEEKLKKDHDDIWEKIHDHVGTPKEERGDGLFNLNYPTRTVSKIVPREGAEEAFAAMMDE